MNAPFPGRCVFVPFCVQYNLNFDEDLRFLLRPIQSKFQRGPKVLFFLHPIQSKFGGRPKVSSLSNTI